MQAVFVKGGNGGTDPERVSGNCGECGTLRKRKKDRREGKHKEGEKKGVRSKKNRVDRDK